ncbi:hypothetical protein KAJ27_18525, partial [bacterium]|nr:hypothetical protein [bacterium]
SEDKVFPLILYAFNDKHEKIDNVTIYPQRVICSVAIKKFEKKNVPIILKLRNNVARGYELTYSNIIPENIDIYGPKTKVDKAGPFYVNHSLNNLKKDFEVDKILKCKEEDELCFKGYKSTSSYKIQLNVREKQLEKKFFKLPLNSIFNQNKDFFYRIDTPATVDVRITGPELLVDGVFSSEVIPYIDVNNSLEGDWTMTIETKLPKGIKLIRLYPNNAKITIVKNLDKDNK